MTYDHRGHLDPPPNRVGQVVAGKSAAEMRARHLDWVAGMGRIPVPRDPKDLPRSVLEHEQHAFDHNIRRGLYVRTTERELAEVQRRGERTTPPEVVHGKLYRFLRRAEQVCFVAMLFAMASQWIEPRHRFRPVQETLLRLAILGGSVVGFWLVKILQFALKRSTR